MVTPMCISTVQRCSVAPAPASGSYPDYCDSTLGRRVASRTVPPIAKLNYLRSVWAPTTRRAKAVGFRLMYDQLRRNPSLRILLPVHRVRVVHLVRHNLLAHLCPLRPPRNRESTSPVRPRGGLTPSGSTPHVLVSELERRQRAQDAHRNLLRTPSAHRGFV